MLDVPKRCVLRSIQLNFLMTSSINSGKEFKFSKFSDYIELGEVVDKSGCFAIMQKDVNRLEKGSDRNLMQFNK